MANKMNIILLITVTFTPALGHGQNSKPCMKGKDTGFMKKHIIPKDFGEDKAQWSKYLKDKGLCGRNDPLPQSFIYNTVDKVKEICSPNGEYVSGNLCRSRSNMIVYDVKSKEDCTVKNVTTKKHKVAVACDMVGEECLPVHYQAKINVIPKGDNCTK